MTEPEFPNPFKKFSSMTYGVSIYLHSPEQFREMVNNQKKDVTGLELLIQSGGAYSGESDAKNNGNFGAKRNQFFTKDFYLDDIQIESYVSGTSTGGPTNAYALNFTVTEPAGLSFIDRLNKAADSFNASLGRKDFNSTRQTYLMVIRFYGYDEDDNQILNGKFDKTSDPEAFNEKWIPFQINRLTFNIENNAVVYNCECTTAAQQVAFGQIHGTVPHNIALQGKTLSELLDGTKSKKTSGNAATSGLMAALNKNQNQLAIDNKYEYPDVYEIEFEDDAMANAKFDPNGTTPVIQRTSMYGNAEAAPSTGDAKFLNGAITFGSEAGMKIPKVIDMAIRASSYISDQYSKVHDENKDNTTRFKQNNENVLNWFKIRPRVEILNFDKKRQDWAYKIVYVVSRYEIRSTDTRDFTSKSCVPIQKEYDYWFTGQNTEVLEYSQQYNYMYYQTFDSKHKEDASASPKEQRNLRTMFFYRPNSMENHTGENLTDEQAANVASVLYSPGDNVQCEMDIVGDPDWISQSEIFYSAAKNSTRDARMIDGSINHDVAEVFFTINFNTVVDYDLNTGVADTTTKNLLKDPAAQEGGVSQYSFLYRANSITTQLSQGRFVQQLQGSLMSVPESCVLGKDTPKEAREVKVKKPAAATGGQKVAKPPQENNITSGAEAEDLFNVTHKDINLESFRPVNSKFINDPKKIRIDKSNINLGGKRFK